MKKFALLFLLLSGLTQAQTPEWSWAKMGSGTYDDQSRSVAMDALGNVYITGRFGSDDITFPPVNVPNSGAQNTGDFFLTKYDAGGNIQWIATAGGSDDDEGMSVTTDAAGNIYVAGYFESPALVIGSYSLTNHSSNGTADIFVAKYNSSGNVVWASRYGGALQEWPYSIVADSQGNTYLSGIFYSLGPAFGPYTVVQSGQGDAFVARFNSSGVPQWAQQIGGGSPDNIWASSLTSSGNVVVVGDFKSSALGYMPNLVNAGGYDIFIATYDQNAGVQMSKSFGGVNDENLYAVSTDNLGNIYIAGAFMSPTLVMGTTTLTNVTGRDMFIAKLNSSGTVLWAQRNSGNAFSEPRALNTDAAGNVYLTGSFTMPSMTFGSTTLNNHPSMGMDSYIVKYNSNGNVIWAKSISDHANEISMGMTSDALGNIILTGTFGHTVTIGSHQLNGSSQGGAEIFVARLCNVPGTPTIVPGVTVCPNSIATLSLNIPADLNCNWYSAAANGSLLATASSFSTSTSLTAFVSLMDTIPGCGMSSPLTPVNFSIHPEAVISISGTSLTANVNTSAGFNYQWFDCNYGGLVSEYSNLPFQPYENGSYALIISIGNCVDTSDCYSYITTSLDSYSHNTNLKAYSSDRNIIIEGGQTELFISDLLGRHVRNIEKTEGKTVVYDLQPGVYLINDKSSKAIKVIVQ